MSDSLRKSVLSPSGDLTSEVCTSPGTVWVQCDQFVLGRFLDSFVGMMKRCSWDSMGSDCPVLN